MWCWLDAFSVVSRRLNFYIFLFVWLWKLIFCVLFCWIIVLNVMCCWVCLVCYCMWVWFVYFEFYIRRRSLAVRFSSKIYLVLSKLYCVDLVYVVVMVKYLNYLVDLWVLKLWLFVWVNCCEDSSRLILIAFDRVSSSFREIVFVIFFVFVFFWFCVWVWVNLLFFLFSVLNCFYCLCFCWNCVIFRASSRRLVVDVAFWLCFCFVCKLFFDKFVCLCLGFWWWFFGCFLCCCVRCVWGCGVYRMCVIVCVVLWKVLERIWCVLVYCCVWCYCVLWLLMCVVDCVVDCVREVGGCCVCVWCCGGVIVFA